MTDRIIEAEKIPEDEANKSLRPTNLREFIGQELARANLGVFIEAARRREAAMDHVLLHGPPGLGKTTLAQIIARELGVGFRSTSGPVLVKAGDLAAILTNLQPHDLLFIDEIHRLNPAVEEILYPAMEDYKIDIIIGEGPAARSVQIELPPFTLVAATTRAGLISAPLRDRFGIPVHLQFYEVSELELITRRSAQLLKLPITSEGAHEIARRSRGTPRIAGRLLRRVRDFATVMDQESISQNVAKIALDRLDIDEHGLDTVDRQYLERLANHYGGGPVGVETLAAALAEQKDVLEDVVEPYLIQQGLLQRTSRGRVLTSEGYKYLGCPSPTEQQDKLQLVEGKK